MADHDGTDRQALAARSGGTRRALLGAGAAAVFAACAPHKAGASAVLNAGDQRGGSRVILEASHGLEKLPYRIVWSEFPNAAPLLEALNARAIDTGIGGDAAFILAIGSGAGIKAIGAQKSEGLGPVVVVRSDSPARDLGDLAGRKVATPRGSISHNLVLAALEAQGRPLDAVRFAFLSPSDGRAALQSGAVDAWAIWDPYAAIAEQQGARVLTGGEGLVPGYTLMFGGDAAIQAKREVLVDYHRRLHDAWWWQDRNRDAYAELMHRETGVELAALQHAARRTRRYPAKIDARMIAEEQATADRYLRAGLISRPIDVRRGFDPSFDA